MHVIVFAVHLDKLRLKVGTHATEHAAHIVRHVFREHLAAVFGHVGLTPTLRPTMVRVGGDTPISRIGRWRGTYRPPL